MLTIRMRLVQDVNKYAHSDIRYIQICGRFFFESRDTIMLRSLYWQKIIFQYSGWRLHKLVVAMSGDKHPASYIGSCSITFPGCWDFVGVLEVFCKGSVVKWCRMCRDAVAKSGQHPAMLLMITISHSCLFSCHYLRDLWGVCGLVLRCLGHVLPDVLRCCCYVGFSI